MNKNISKLIIAFIAVLFAWTTASAQGTKTMYVMKDGLVIYQSAVAEVDSLIFYAPAISVTVTGVSLDKTTYTLPAGTSFTLVPTVVPSNASNQNVTWSSSNTGIATVDATGKVTAGSTAGTATITVTTVDGGKTASCVVTVPTIITKYVVGEAPNAPYTPLLTTPYTISVGQTVATGVYLASLSAPPTGGTGWEGRYNFTWESSNTAVATINDIGQITGVSNGITTIKATVNNSQETQTSYPTGATLSFTLTVSNTPATKVTSTCYVDRAPNFKGTFSNTAIVNGKVELTGTATTGTYTSPEFATVDFTRLVGSWNVSHVNVSGSTVEVKFRVKTTGGTWSSYLSYQQWGFKRGASTSCTSTDVTNKSVDTSGGVASISYDEISGGTYNTFQYEVTLRRTNGSTASPKIKAISATLYRSSGDTFSAPSAAKEWPITGSNILRQQDVDGIGESICSPTCVTMLMVHKGITDFGGCTYKHEYTARKIVYDGRLYGNWAFCCSAMGSWDTTDYIAYARHIYSSNEIAQLLTKGPIAASIQGNVTGGAFKDINGTTQYSGTGHLIVVRGFEMSGSAVSNFIISDPNTGTGTQNYKVTAAELFRCMVSKIVYVLE